MNPVVDTIMIILFVLFMIYIFRGYHHAKYLERYGDEEISEEKKKDGKEQDAASPDKQ